MDWIAFIAGIGFGSTATAAIVYIYTRWEDRKMREGGR